MLGRARPRDDHPRIAARRHLRAPRHRKVSVQGETVQRWWWLWPRRPAVTELCNVEIVYRLSRMSAMRASHVSAGGNVTALCWNQAGSTIWTTVARTGQRGEQRSVRGSTPVSRLRGLWSARARRAARRHLGGLGTVVRVENSLLTLRDPRARPALWPRWCDEDEGMLRWTPDANSRTDEPACTRPRTTA